jgi:hypothetical protein
VVMAEEWPALMGMKWLNLKWCFTLRNEEGGRGNRCGMWCGTRGSASMAGRSWGSTGRRCKAAGGDILASVREEEDGLGWAGWAERPRRAAALLA